MERKITRPLCQSLVVDEDLLGLVFFLVNVASQKSGTKSRASLGSSSLSYRYSLKKKRRNDFSEKWSEEVQKKLETNISACKISAQNCDTRASFL